MTLRRAIVTVLLLIMFTLSGCSLFPEEEVDAIPTLITPPESRTVTYTAELGTIAEELRTTGRVAPAREETLYFVQSGRVRHVNTALNQPVKQGDVLLQLDVESTNQQLALARLDMKKLELRLERLAFDVQFSPGSSLDLELMQIDHEKALLQIQQLEDTIEDATLRAPFDGVVTALNAAVGERVDEYATVIIVADPTRLELHVELSTEDDFRRIGPGQQARIEIDRTRHTTATVAQVPTYAQRNATGPQRDRRVRLTIEDTTVLRLNQTVTTVITLQEKQNAVLVPNAAVREFMGRTYLRIIEDDVRREVDIETGIRTATHTEVLRGIDAGTVVIGR